jgi:hypothetical protein
VSAVHEETPAPIALRGVPEHLEARPVYRYRTSADGERVPVRNRHGLLKLARVELIAVLGTRDVLALSQGDEAFVLGATRRSWQSIERRFGNKAWEICVTFARAGIVRLHCNVSDRLEIGGVIDWTLSDEWARRRADRAADRHAVREGIRSRALEIADQVEDICPELADVLRTAPSHLPGLPALTAVAIDLNDGIVNANPRSFSQRHFGSTKSHDDVAKLLDRAGVPDWVADVTGVRRSSRIGVAGCIEIRTAVATLPANALAGPVILRCDQADLVLALTTNSPSLVVVENLQAAETLADTRRDLAIIYTGGMPSKATLSHIRSLAESAEMTVIVTDADLGGVRIAEQLLTVAPDARVLDVGAVPHDSKPPWRPENGYRRAVERSLSGPAASLAQAVLARGYPLEQELLIAAAVNIGLRKS